jgi:hypothetical protein
MMLAMETSATTDMFNFTGLTTTAWKIILAAKFKQSSKKGSIPFAADSKRIRLVQQNNGQDILLKRRAGGTLMLPQYLLALCLA